MSEDELFEIHMPEVYKPTIKLPEMKYKLLKASPLDPNSREGDTVYHCIRPTYGVVRDDERAFGYECVAVTYEEDGGYPFFVVPRRDLEVLK